MNKVILVKIAIGVGSFIAGGGVGAGITAFALNKKNDAYNRTEMRMMRDHYREKEQEFEDEKLRLKAAIDIHKNSVKDDGPYTEPEEETEFDDEEEENVDDILDNYTPEEVVNRDESRPFVLSQEEFDLNETEYDQSTITYYVDDDVLADERDQPIIKVEATVGDGLTEFGNMSNDRNVVYIRNHDFEQDFEVIRVEDSYSSRVLGFDFNGAKEELRKMRDND